MNRRHFLQSAVAPALITALRVLLRSLWQAKGLPLTGAVVCWLSGLLAGAAATVSPAAERMVFPSAWSTRVELNLNETRNVTYDDGSEQRDFTPVRVFSAGGAGQAGMLGLFGDGSPPEVVAGNKPAMTHAYAAPGLYTVIRVAVDGGSILIEVKSTTSPRLAIREGVGQLLEYALYPPPASEQVPRLIVAAPSRPDPDDAAYLASLTKRFRLNIEYFQATPDLSALPF
jgi:hypothetical protein